MTWVTRLILILLIGPIGFVVYLTLALVIHQREKEEKKQFDNCIMEMNSRVEAQDYDRYMTLKRKFEPEVIENKERAEFLRLKKKFEEK